MKNEFKKVAQKTKLFAQQAVVMSVSLHAEASIKETLNGEVVRNETLTPAKAFDDFLVALDNAKIPHEVISREGDSLVFAVARERKDEAWNATGRFFGSGSRALLASAYGAHESYDPLANVVNAVLKPFSSTRREVSQAVQRLKQR